MGSGDDDAYFVSLLGLEDLEDSVCLRLGRVRHGVAGEWGVKERAEKGRGRERWWWSSARRAERRQLDKISLSDLTR